MHVICKFDPDKLQAMQIVNAFGVLRIAAPLAPTTNGSPSSNPIVFIAIGVLIAARRGLHPNQVRPV